MSPTRLLLAWALFVQILPLSALAEPHTAFPVDIVPGPAPQPVTANGRTALLYELHLTNFSRSPVEILQLDVLGDDAASPLASFQGEALEKLLVAVGTADSPDKVRAIGGGRSVVIFLDLMLEGSAHAPRTLRHRLRLSISKKKGGTGGADEDTVNGPVVAVVRDPTPVLHPPLKGSGWVAFNGVGSDSHRRSMVPVDGKVRIAQRFAIDWMRLGADGRLFDGEAKSNASFPGYGAEVLAVADGLISDLKDGLPENAGVNEESSRNITLDNVAGNFLILDVGHGRFATYAHLKAGSFRIKLGDRVKAGQVLALLGNSDAPHLHCHLTDGNSSLGSEGVPYAFESFTMTGLMDVEASSLLDKGQAWQPKTRQEPVVHRREVPVDNAFVTLP